MKRPSRQLQLDVIARAGDRCEYCQLPQAGQEATFHIDHVIPVAQRGETTFDNLALACVSCSLRKGARRWLYDVATREQVSLFNPRSESWPEHFRWRGVEIEGLTGTGRATVIALAMNRPLMLAIRRGAGQ